MEQAELAALATAYAGPEAATALAEQLRPEWVEPRNRKVLAAIRSLLERGADVDVGSLAVALETEGLGKREAVALAADVGQAAAGARNLPHWIAVVRDAWARRELVAGLREQLAVLEAPGSASNSLGSLATLCHRVGGDNKLQGPRRALEIAHEAMAELEARRLAGHQAGVPWGLAALDDVTAGLHPGELTVIAGVSGGGKTALMLQVCEAAAARYTALVFSLEMPRTAVLARQACGRTGVSFLHYRRGDLTQEESESLQRGFAELGELSLHIDDASELTVEQLRWRAKMLAARPEGLHLVAVDYLQLLACEGVRGGGGGNREQEVAAIAKGLKSLAKDLRVPVIALSQLNDDGHMRESRAIKHAADLVLVIERAQDSSEASIRIDKARFGALGSVPLGWDGPRTRYY